MKRILINDDNLKIDDLDFLVYVNVETGKEEDILMILETEGGVLTM